MHGHQRSIPSVLALIIGSVVVGRAPARATTVVVQPSSQDAYLLQNAPNRVAGSGPLNTRIRVAPSPLSAVWRGLVQFNLGAIPQFATINAATLELYERNNPMAVRLHGVHRVTGAWLQSTVKWNTQPAHQAGATATAAVGTSQGFRSFVVTGDIQAFANNPGSNHGWMVKDAAETVGADQVNYVALEESDVHEIGFRPRLTVDYTAPPCTVNADCADTNPCTTNERCTMGFCAVDPTSCDDNDACTDDLCDPDQGCVNVVGECNDGFDCTIDACDPQGGCTHTPVDSACTAEGCKEGTCVADPDNPSVDPQTGCVFTATLPDDTACVSDGDQCTDDTCLTGVCTHPLSMLGAPCGADGNPCTDDVCDGAGNCGVNNTAPCAADGNPCTDDVCDGAGNCGVNNTAPCEDGDLCTLSDACAGGSCQSGDAVVCTPLDACHDAGTCDSDTGLCSNPPKANGEPCDDGDGCTHDDACDGAGVCLGSATPENGCREAVLSGKALLILKDKTPDKRDRLTWKWVKGSETLLAALGNPLTTTGYTLCVFDASTAPQPRLQARAPAGGTCVGHPCWQTTTTGFKYKDAGLDPDGLNLMRLTKGASSVAKVILRGKGENLTMPPLPLTPKVTVQLKSDLGECWSADYSTFYAASSEQYKAKGD